MMTDPQNALLQRLDARQQIEDLITRYCIACDDRELDMLASLFTEDAYFGDPDGVRGGAGRDAIRQQYRDVYQHMGPSFHWTHDRLITVDADNPDHANGTILAHCEMSYDGTSYLIAIRYTDQYRRVNEAWKIARRECRFLYFTPVADYPDILNREKRVYRGGEWQQANLPEALYSWVSFYGVPDQ